MKFHPASLPFRLIAAAALVLASACTSAIIDDERAGSPECDNLDQAQCIFPFPSDHYRSTESGVPRLAFPDGSLPSRGMMEVAPTGFNMRGGFSVITPIYFVLDGVTLEGAPRWNDIDLSLTSASRTLVIDAETGELMPHWAEFEHYSTMFADDEEVPFKPVIALRLARRLEESRRYVVAVQGMVDADGRTLPATPGFAPLRDREPSTFVGVGKRRERYEAEIIPVLERIGVRRDALQLAWDFTTDSEKNVTGTLLAMRDALFEVIGEEGPEYELLVEEGATGRGIAKMIRGVAKVPSFLEGKSGQLQRLRRDADGNPVHQGFEDVEFDLQIPVSVWEGDAPGYVVQYGHGLLGGRSEATTRFLQEFSNESGFLLMATDLKGMATEDLGIWLGVLTGDLSNLPYLSEKPHQGIINHLALARLLKSKAFSEDPRIVREDGGPAYDPTRVVYNGNSQGGTMGGVMMPIQTDITRGVLGVPGGAFNLLLSRTHNFAALVETTIASFRDNLPDFTAVMGLIQIGFDAIDAINYMHRLSGETFPGTPEHRVLLIAAREDAQVHNQVTDLVARTTGATLLSPTVRDVWGLPTSAGPVAGTAMSEYDFGKPHFPNEPVPGRYDTHACLRYLEPAREQIRHYFLTGEAKNFCDRACIAPVEFNQQHCRDSD